MACVKVGQSDNGAFHSSGSRRLLHNHGMGLVNIAAFIVGNVARKAPAGSHSHGHPTRSIGGKSEKNIDQRRENEGYRIMYKKTRQFLPKGPLHLS